MKLHELADDGAIHPPTKVGGTLAPNVVECALATPFRLRLFNFIAANRGVILKQIERDFNVGKTALKTQLNVLEGAGLILVEKRPGGACRHYQTTLGRRVAEERARLDDEARAIVSVVSS